MLKKVIAFRTRVRTWKIPAILLNRYVFTTFIFAVWMFFFDQNNFFTQMKRYHSLRDARNKTAYFKEQTVQTGDELNKLLSNTQSLEKFAREKYYMKKPDEDVFVILDK